MTELEKIVYTKKFVDALASGESPLDGAPISEQELLRNPRIAKCLSYVSELLDRIVCTSAIWQTKEERMPAERENDFRAERVIERQRALPTPFEASADMLADFRFTEYPVRISYILNGINSCLRASGVRDHYLPYRAVLDYLTDRGFLRYEMPEGASFGKPIRMPTDSGREIGIESRASGRFLTLYFSGEAQRLIVSSIAEIAARPASESEDAEEDGE